MLDAPGARVIGARQQRHQGKGMGMIEMHHDEGPTRERHQTLSVSVVIPAYTMKRWELLHRAVESARAQTVQIDHVVVCIDNNEELLERARNEWAQDAGTRVKVIPNQYSDHLTRTTAHQAAHGTTRRFGAGSARNTASQAIASDVIAFMDDDAHAQPDWIEQLLDVFAHPSIVAVGGPPLPAYETARPSWFPRNFDWVFGCAYEGLPSEVGPLRHLIGANMAVRRSAWEAVGGFVGSDFDDLNLCMRLAERFGATSIYYNPNAVVHHHVPSERVSWRYFWRRCYFVNREKVRVFRRMGSAANLTAERQFVLRALTRQLGSDLRRASRGELRALGALGAMIAGIALAGAGHVRGQLDQLIAK
jgi:glucosyl-dolichyl phosphate glucuronosyltransferase